MEQYVVRWLRSLSLTPFVLFRVVDSRDLTLGNCGNAYRFMFGLSY